MKGKLYRLVIRALNGQRISKILYTFAHSRVSKPFIKPYAKFYKIDVEEAKLQMEQFTCLHDFFTRELKKDVRPIDKRENHVISPVDGTIAEYGTISVENEMIVKNKPYSITELLGSVERANQYIGGTYVVIYLSPANYHRIHAPFNGKVLHTYELGGRSYPVNQHGLKYGDATLAKNYRTITELKTDTCRYASINVGAMFVNSIVLTNKDDHWTKGEEVAYFSFGSTVVLLFEKNTFDINKDLYPQASIKLGMSIGTCKS